MEITDLPKPVQNKITNYSSRLASPEVWERWGEDITQVTVDAFPDTVDAASKVLPLITAFAISLDGWGFAPPLAEHFTPAKVERHSATVPRAQTGRTVRHALTDVGRSVNPRAGWPVKRPPLPQSSRLHPYDRPECRSIMRSATHWSPPWQRQMFQVSVGLGFGAGLDGRSIPLVTGDHLIAHGHEIVLTSFEHLPDMAIGGVFAKWLSDWKGQLASNDQPILGPATRINNGISQLRGDDNALRIQLARLRTTFVVNLIENDLPLRQILALSGMKGPSSLDSYIVHATQAVDASERFAQIPRLHEWAV